MRFTLSLNAKYKAFDGKLDQGEVKDLIKSAGDFGGISAEEKQELRALLLDPSMQDKFTPDARVVLQKHLGYLPDTIHQRAENARQNNSFSMLGLLDAQSKGKDFAGTKPSKPDPFTAALNKKLSGPGALIHFNAYEAGVEMAALSQLDDRRLSHVADNLGANKTQLLLDKLSPKDRVAYRETVAKLDQAHFGSVLRAAEERGLAPKDTTANFDSTMSQVQAGTHELPADANDFVYLSVPGLNTEHYPNYMDKNEQRLKDKGLTVYRSNIDTDLGSEANAATLRKEINDLAAVTGKKVVVLAHSKGGPDAALALQDKKTEDNVHLFVAMQPAYGGTPVADTVIGDSNINRLTNDVMKNIWNTASGNEAIKDLSFASQKARFSLDEGNPPLHVTTLSLATTASSAAQKSTTALGQMDRFMTEQHYGDKAVSDGMVPYTSQLIPGKDAYFVKVEGMGHDETIGQGRDPKYSPEDLTEALISVGLRQAAQRAED